MATGKRFLSIEEACSSLGISRVTAWRRLRDGSMPSARLGRRVLIPASYFDQLEASALEGAR